MDEFFILGGIEMWLADLIGGVVVLLLGFAVVFFSRQLPYMSEYGPGPGFFPLWLGLGIIGCGIGGKIKVQIVSA